MGWSNSSSSSTEKYPSLLLLCFPSAIPLIVQLLLRQIHHIQSCYLLICINALQNLIIEMRPHSANLRALTNEEEHKNYCHKITNDSAVYLGPDTLFVRKMFFIFLSISLNMCFGCSKEPSHRDGSFDTHNICFR